MRYDVSTQQQRWQWGHADEVLRMRREANERSAREAAAAVAELERQQEQVGDARARTGEAGGERPLDCAQERQIRRYFSVQMGKLCSSLSIPPKVRGTALTYFHRFYLHHSVMDAEPKSIMMAAVYVACKTEENYIAAEDLARMAKQDPSIVLREELNLLNGLNFDLIVHHPYRPLLGIQFLLDDLSGGGGGSAGAADERSSGVYSFAKTKENRADVIRKARHAVDAVMMTDAPLLYAPGLLALACFRCALKEELTAHEAHGAFILMAKALVDQMSGQPEGPETTMAFLRALEGETAAPGPSSAIFDDIDSYIQDGRMPVDQESVREIDRQLRGCRNPVRNKDAEHYKRVHAKKFEEMETRRQQKQAAKRAAHEASMSALAMPPPPESYVTAKRRKTATP